MYCKFAAQHAYQLNRRLKSGLVKLPRCAKFSFPRSHCSRMLQLKLNCNLGSEKAVLKIKIGTFIAAHLVDLIFATISRISFIHKIFIT
jgi:hypothetical protein